MARKIPMRRCVATGEQLPKKELLRVVRTPEGTLAVDVTGKANGRGAYLKKIPLQLRRHVKRKLWNGHLKYLFRRNSGLFWNRQSADRFTGMKRGDVQPA